MANEEGPRSQPGPFPCVQAGLSARPRHAGPIATSSRSTAMTPIRPVRILGLDPGLRRTGWGVIVCEGARLSHVAHGVIAPKDSLPFPERLLILFDQISRVIVDHAPDEAAVEETFMNNNAASALKLGHARAMALVAPARAGLPVAEYAATVVKKAVVGTGGADKSQVGWMIARLLPTAGQTASDSADALAVAIAHAHARTARRVA